MEIIYPDGSNVVYDSAVDEMPESTSDTYELESGEKIIINIKCTVLQEDFVTEGDRLIFSTESDVIESNTIVYYINPDDVIHEWWNKDVIPDDEIETEINPEDITETPIEEHTRNNIATQTAFVKTTNKYNISGIVDYVPTGLELNQDYNIGENNYWTSISHEELTNKYISNSVLETKEGDNRSNIYDRFNKTYYDYDSK